MSLLSNDLRGRIASHSFIYYLCVKKLKLFVSSLNKDLVVETSINCSVLTSNVCSNYPVEISSRSFLIDQISLPLSQIDVILGVDWLSSKPCLVKLF